MLGSTPDLQVEERLYFKAKPTLQEVREVVGRLPGGARDLLSTRSRRYKELGLGDRELGEEELIALLAEEPGLWRRPVVIHGEKVVIGFDAAKLTNLVR